jgi:hypothetical protein
LPANAAAITLKGGLRHPGKNRRLLRDGGHAKKQEEDGMPVITGFDQLASVPEEQITE